MRDEAGAENFFLFGLFADGTFSHGDTEVFRPLVDNLRYDDPFLVLADYAAYIECQGG